MVRCYELNLNLSSCGMDFDNWEEIRSVNELLIWLTVSC